MFVLYVFRRYQSGDLVTSLKLIPIRCATKLCHFGQTRTGSEAIHFFLLSSTAVSSATSDQVAIPKRCGQNEEPDSRNQERTRNEPISAPKTYLNDAKSNHVYL